VREDEHPHGTAEAVPPMAVAPPQTPSAQVREHLRLPAIQTTPQLSVRVMTLGLVLTMRLPLLLLLLRTVIRLQHLLRVHRRHRSLVMMRRPQLGRLLRMVESRQLLRRLGEEMMRRCRVMIRQVLDCFARNWNPGSSDGMGDMDLTALYLRPKLIYTELLGMGHGVKQSM